VKKYDKPEIMIVEVKSADVISASGGINVGNGAFTEITNKKTQFASIDF
jgi:hypothetical protein